jgi:hypothetical protein
LEFSLNTHRAKSGGPGADDNALIDESASMLNGLSDRFDHEDRHPPGNRQHGPGVRRRVARAGMVRACHHNEPFFDIA